MLLVDDFIKDDIFFDTIDKINEIDNDNIKITNGKTYVYVFNFV